MYTTTCTIYFKHYNSSFETETEEDLSGRNYLDPSDFWPIRNGEDGEGFHDDFLSALPEMETRPIAGHEGDQWEGRYKIDSGEWCEWEPLSWYSKVGPDNPIDTAAAFDGDIDIDSEEISDEEE